MIMSGYWCAVADFKDGTRIEKHYPYKAGANYLREQEEQYEIECDWISRYIEPTIDVSGECTFYSVDYVDERW